MRQLYFNEKDLATRQKEMRRIFWERIGEEQLGIAKKRLEDALDIELSEALGAGLYERKGDRKGYRGGYRYRDLQTWGGRLQRVKVPKAEKGYRFRLLKPWARHVEKFGEAVYRAFVNGMSDRKVSRYFEELYGAGVLSAGGVSTIYRKLSEDVAGWHCRSIEDTYRFLYLDGMYQSVRNTVGGRRVVLAAMGVREDGRVEIVDFRVETGESASAWSRFIQSLYERGLVGQSLKLIIHDGCPGLMDTLRWVWPDAKTQLCSVHHLRNLGDRVGARHVRRRILKDAGQIYQAQDRAEALRRALHFQARWRHCEPRAVRLFMRTLDLTLGFMDFPKHLWGVLKSTNPLERYFGEWKRRLKTMGALPNPGSCDRIVFALSQDFNKQQEWFPVFRMSELSVA